MPGTNELVEIVAEWFLFKPSDWFNGTIERILR